MFTFRPGRLPAPVPQIQPSTQGLGLAAGVNRGTYREHWLLKLLFGEEPSKGMGEDSWEF
jgi:hypothetical protein